MGLIRGLLPCLFFLNLTLISYEARASFGDATAYPRGVEATCQVLIAANAKLGKTQPLYRLLRDSGNAAEFVAAARDFLQSAKYDVNRFLGLFREQRPEPIFYEAAGDEVGMLTATELPAEGMVAPEEMTLNPMMVLFMNPPRGSTIMEFLGQIFYANDDKERDSGIILAVEKMLQSYPVLSVALAVEVVTRTPSHFGLLKKNLKTIDIPEPVHYTPGAYSRATADSEPPPPPRRGGGRGRRLLAVTLLLSAVGLPTISSTWEYAANRWNNPRTMDPVAVVPNLEETPRLPDGTILPDSPGGIVVKPLVPKKPDAVIPIPKTAFRTRALGDDEVAALKAAFAKDKDSVRFDKPVVYRAEFNAEGNVLAVEKSGTTADGLNFQFALVTYRPDGTEKSRVVIPELPRDGELVWQPIDFLVHSGGSRVVIRGRAANSTDGDRFFVADLAKDKIVTNFKPASSAYFFGGRFSNSGRFWAGIGERTVKIVDLDTGKEVVEINLTSTATAVAFSPNDSRIAVGTQEGDIYTYRSANGKLETSIRSGERRSISTLNYSSGGEGLISATIATISTWDATSGERREKITFGADPRRTGVYPVYLSPLDGLVIAHESFSSGDDTIGEVSAWSAADGKKIASVAMGTGVLGLRYSPDGRKMMILGKDRKVYLYSIAP